MTSFGIWRIEGYWQVKRSPGRSGTSWNHVVVNSSDGEGTKMWKMYGKKTHLNEN